jgi:hypothetical protein
MFPRVPSIFFMSETSKHAAFARSMRLTFAFSAAPWVLKQYGNISNPSSKAVGYVMRDHGENAVERSGRKNDSDAYIRLRRRVLPGVEYFRSRLMRVPWVSKPG